MRAGGSASGPLPLLIAEFVTNERILSAKGMEEEFNDCFSRQILAFGGTISITIA